MKELVPGTGSPRSVPAPGPGASRCHLLVPAGAESHPDCYGDEEGTDECVTCHRGQDAEPVGEVSI